jgi:hypothetical protein
MDLKQDFWSMRGQMMYFAIGLLCRNVKKHRVRLIPVAMGTTKQLVTEWTPANFMMSRTKELVILFKRLEPAAFGCTAEISPDRPIP